MLKLKILSAFFSIIILTSISSYVKIPNLGRLTYWYSDSDLIGKWSSNTIYLKNTKLNSNTSFYFSSGFANARSQWSDALGVSLQLSSSNAKLICYGGTRTELNSTGIFTPNYSRHCNYS